MVATVYRHGYNVVANRTDVRFWHMSALPPKADIGTQSSNVRFVPIADIVRFTPVAARLSTDRHIADLLKPKPKAGATASQRALKAAA